MTLLASVDGAISPSGEATIAITDEGLLRGDGAFEVIRLYEGRPFALDEHYARLMRSCAGLRLEADHAALRTEVDSLLEESDPGDALLRLVVTRGGRRIAIIEPLPPTPASQSVMTVTYTPNRVLDGLKTLSYAANMLAVRIAKDQGADEALFVTPHGRVLEGPTWSFFWAREGKLLTPPLEDRILRSITREVLLEVCDVEERITTLDDLTSADEAFVASTLREAVPISAIDGRALPAAPGPLTTAAGEALRQHVAKALAVT